MTNSKVSTTKSISQQGSFSLALTLPYTVTNDVECSCGFFYLSLHQTHQLPLQQLWITSTTDTNVDTKVNTKLSAYLHDSVEFIHECGTVKCSSFTKSKNIQVITP